MSGIDWSVELRFMVALALGFLVGLEREQAALTEGRRFPAGVRTFTLAALMGFGCAWLHQQGADLALPVGLAALAALAMGGYAVKRKQGHTGWTSEVAILVTYLTGALALLADIWLAMALGIVAALLLSEKAEIEHHLERLNRAEFLAVLKFLLITLIVLPVLPDQGYTPFQLNPQATWRIVVLVSSVGFVGYFLSRQLGDRAGLPLSGLLGGIVSSTAVCVAMGREARRAPHRSGAALRGALLAGVMMYPRLLILVWCLNPALGQALWPRMLALAAVGGLLAWRSAPRAPGPAEGPAPGLENPFDLNPALVFAGLFTLLSVATEVVRTQLGSAGLLTLAGMAGAATLDPFILSLARDPGPLTPLAVQAVTLAVMTNTLAKGGYLAALAPSARKPALALFGGWAALHLPLVIWR